MIDESMAGRAAAHDGVPGELRAIDQWLVWRFVTKAGKPTKVPFVPWWPDQAASSTDPNTWDTFGRAVEAYANVRSLAGIGFVFRDGDGLYGIDLDDSLSPDGTLVPWARAIYDRCGLVETYVEVSPSGTGVKGWLRGELPHDPDTGEVPTGRNRKRKDGAGQLVGGGIEMYQAGRYFCTTGRRFPGSAAAVGSGDPAELARLFHSLKPKIERPAAKPGAVPPGSAPADAGNKLERCWAYLRKCPPSISGAGGHDAALRAACEAVRFDLGDAEAFEVLRRWNEHMSDEKWTERELAHKLASARKHAVGERGRRLREERKKTVYSARRPALTLTLPLSPALAAAGGDRGAV